MDIIINSIFYHGIFRLYKDSTLQEIRQLQGIIRKHSEVSKQEYIIDSKAIDGTIIRKFKGWRYIYKCSFDKLDSNGLSIIDWLYKWMCVDDVKITFQPDPTDAIKVYSIFSSSDYQFNHIAYKTFMDKRGILEVQGSELGSSPLPGSGFSRERINTIICVVDKYSDGDIDYKIAQAGATRLFICGHLEGSLSVYIEGYLQEQVSGAGYFQVFLQLPPVGYYALRMKIVGDLDDYVLFQNRVQFQM